MIRSPRLNGRGPVWNGDKPRSGRGGSVAGVEMSPQAGEQLDLEPAAQIT
jgi:hypothetical protein